jgi:hypothetical protein
MLNIPFGYQQNMFSAIYGPGVLNDTIIPGYGITNFPINLNVFSMLPNGTTRNFGGATQYVTYPMGYPNWMYQLAQGFTSPNHISQWNPMLLGTGLENISTFNPTLTQQGQSLAFNYGYNMGVQMQLSSAIKGIASALDSMESGLKNVAGSKGLTNAQKAKIKALIEEVRALRTKIEKQLKANNPTQEDVKKMQEDVLNLQKKVGEVADKIRSELGGSDDTSGSGSVSNDSSTGSGSASGSGSTDSTEDLSGTKYENIDPKTGKPNTLTTPTTAEVDEFCATVFRAVDCPGTENDTLAAAINGLDANNIVEVVKGWEDNYGKHTATGNDGFFARIFDDIDDADQKKYVPIMLKALTKRAEALGIYDEVRTYVSKVNKGLADGIFGGLIGWQDDHKIANALMAIYDKIVEKEKSNVEGIKKLAKKNKAEKAKEAEKNKAKTISEKKAELANRLKEDLKLDKVPTLSSALKVETDDDGEFTGYSITLNTQNGKVTFTGATPNELINDLENKGLSEEDLIRKTQA